MNLVSWVDGSECGMQSIHIVSWYKWMDGCYDVGYLWTWRKKVYKIRQQILIWGLPKRPKMSGWFNWITEYWKFKFFNIWRVFTLVNVYGFPCSFRYTPLKILSFVWYLYFLKRMSIVAFIVRFSKQVQFQLLLSFFRIWQFYFYVNEWWENMLHGCHGSIKTSHACAST